MKRALCILQNKYVQHKHLFIISFTWLYKWVDLYWHNCIFQQNLNHLNQASFFMLQILYLHSEFWNCVRYLSWAPLKPLGLFD